MIRVVIYGGPVMGRFNYKVYTEGTRLREPMTGLSSSPLFDACYRLKQMTAADDGAEIALYDDTRKYENQFRLKTTVGYGAGTTVQETGGAPKFVKRASPEEVARLHRLSAKEAEKTSEGTEIAPQAEKPVLDAGARQETANGVEATGAKSAKPEAIPPPPHTPLASRADTDQDLPRPPRPRPTPHKRKPVKSGGRRGQR